MEASAPQAFGDEVGTDVAFMRYFYLFGARSHVAFNACVSQAGRGIALCVCLRKACRTHARTQSFRSHRAAVVVVRCSLAVVIDSLAQ